MSVVESKNGIVVLGAGQAGAQTAVSLRSEGYNGKITVVGDENHLPYQRPPLSKKFLIGEMTVDRLELKAEQFYHRADIEMRMGVRATMIDRAARLVYLSDQSFLKYDNLIIATGCRASRINVPGCDLPGTYYLRNIGDVARIKDHFMAGQKLVIVGGGYIGLEVAAVAITYGLRVTVLESAERVMARVVAPITSAFYERIHKEEGVAVKTGVTVARFGGKHKVEWVASTEGEIFVADFVIVGVGATPNLELALNAKLAVENGISVDDACRTSDPAIYAAGDCANYPLGERRVRLESVHNAIEQARIVAGAITGKRKLYDQVPWFWSDQYDLKLQIAGLSTGYTQAIVRGNPKCNRSFIVLYLKDDTVISVEAVNTISEFMAAKTLILKRTKLSSSQLNNENVPLKEIVQSIVVSA